MSCPLPNLLPLATNHPIVIPNPLQRVRNRGLVYPLWVSLLPHSPLATRHSPLLLSPPPNTPNPSPPSSPANLPLSTSPPKSVSSTVSSPSPPKAPSNPPTIFPTGASPSP